MKDEKSVIIDFETWERKYKPMESKLAKVEEELKAEKDKKIIEFYLLSRTAKHKISEIVIPSVDVRFNKSFLDNSDYDDYLVEVDEFIRELYLRKSGVALVGRKEVDDYFNRLDDKIKANSKILKENTDKINSLPRIVKIIFGIKKV